MFKWFHRYKQTKLHHTIGILIYGGVIPSRNGFACHLNMQLLIISVSAVISEAPRAIVIQGATHFEIVVHLNSIRSPPGGANSLRFYQGTFISPEYARI